MPTQPKNDQQITSWIATYRASLTRFIRSKVNNMAQVEDIQQEVWLKLLEHPAPQEIERIQNWLFTVARNFITDQRRKHRPYSFSQLADDAAKVEQQVNELFFDTWAEKELPSFIVESAEFWEVLKKELAKLPKEQREVFIAHELDSISFSDLSQQTGLPLNTLISRKRYAVLHLRKRFEHLRTER